MIKQSSQGNSTKNQVTTDLDNNKQPPIRVRQESLYLTNTKSLVNPRFYFNMNSSKQLQRDLLCVGDKDAQVYDPNNEVFSDYDPKLKRYQKSTLTRSFLCIFMVDGDFLLYRLRDKALFTIKGVQKFDTKDHLPRIYLNDQGSIIILKYPNQDYLWMWTMSKESANLNLLSDNQGQLQNMIQPDIPKKPIFRSSSYDRRQSLQENETQNMFWDSKGKQQQQSQDTPQLKGSWLSIYMKDLNGPFSLRATSFQEGFDLKFINLQHSYGVQQSTGIQSTESVKIVQFKLFTKAEYFGNLLRQNKQQMQQSDEDMILEMSSQDLRVNFTNKGGSFFESSSSSNNLRSKITSVEFTGQPIPKHKTIITKLDNSCQLALTVLNSQHMLYCQVLFSNFDTSFSTAIKLFDFVQPEDCPSFDNRGKTNLCIDDVAWTNNDAFVIIIFNSCSFAVLPRLGSSLVQIFNPTILNISQKMVDQFQHYKNPKKFNELILPMQIQQKNSQAKQNLIANQKIITVHPFEESFLISDGQMCFIFRMEFEPELTDLFSKTNMSFFFLRFCISLDKLAVDPDILEKIPQLLTNKLPLFEFEKNAELDEEDDPGQVIMTASQINPYDNNAKRMETNQSFNAEFTLDCQTVLLNLKHLLMGLRWNKNSPINYYQWLITVVNDCFFYFLKNSEPIYAFHALRIAEAYCKKSLFLTESDSDIGLFEARNQEFHSQRNADFTDFNELKRFFDAVHDMYDYHNTKEYMNKTTAEKLLIKYDMFERLPIKLNRGGGNWRFQFTKNYTLLVYYSLIQFRNYQAANFNILFLVFACYILQRYLDTMFLHHLQRIIEIVYRNFQLKKKSDDYELFLGKSGKNFIIGPPEKMKLYQDWVNQVLKMSLEHISQLYDQENLENLMDICINEMNYNNERVEKNTGFLGENGKIFQILHRINTYEDKSGVMLEVKKMIDQVKGFDDGSQLLKIKTTEFNIGVSLYMIMEYTRRNLIEQREEMINIYDLFSCIQNLVISTNQIHSTNFIDQFSNILDTYFKPSPVKNEFLTLIPQFQNIPLQTRKQILAVMYFHFNDLEKVTSLLNESNDSKLLKLQMLSTNIKQALRSLEQINQANNQNDSQKFINENQINQFQQKANCLQTIRRCLVYLKESFQELYLKQNLQAGEKKQNLTQTIWAIASTLPVNASSILKEELAHHSLKNLHKIFKYTKISCPITKQNYTLKNSQQIEDSENLIISHAIMTSLFGSKAITQLYSFINQKQISKTFLQQFELAIVSLINEENGKLFVQSIDNQIIYIGLDNQENNVGLNVEKKKQTIADLIIKDFKKFSKLCFYILSVISYHECEDQLQEQINKIVLKEDKSIKSPQIELNYQYLYHLLVLSLFEKYQQSQLIISKAFTLLRTMILQQAKSPSSKNIQNLIGLISYSNLNRLNKQKVSQLLELSKQHLSHNKELIQAFENLIFSESTINPLDNLLKEYEHKLINQINNINLKSLMTKGDNLAKRLKMQLYERCLTAREIFGISFEYSYYFDKTNFERRQGGHIFGINDQNLDKFKSLMMKQEEKQRIQKEKARLQQESQDQIDSFRGRQQNNKGASSSIESARTSYIVVDSPGRALGSKVIIQDEETNEDLAKGLMRNRQMGVPMTPKKGQNIQIQQEIGKLLQEGAAVENPKFRFNKLKQREPSISNSKNLRNESVEFENREQATAKIMKVTKKRNSVRRQFVFMNSAEEKEQEPSKNIQDKNTMQKRGQHRKGQMSMNPTGANFGGNFNLRNQKLISGENYQTQISQQQMPPKPGPPPGLPRAGGNVSKRINKSSRANLQSQTFEQKLSKPENKLQNLIKLFEKHDYRIGFNKWKQAIQKDQKKAVNSQQNSQSQANPIPLKGSFNLLLVKKEGENYLVQDAKEILMKKSQGKTPTTIQIQQQDKIGQPQQMQQQKQQILPSKQIITAKPFEFIRVQNSQVSGNIIAQNIGKQREENKEDQNVKKIQIKKQPINQQKKINSKEQYLNFLQKFKQISEKIDKVSKEANLLNSEFTKMN